jgi:hypothetical protein
MYDPSYAAVHFHFGQIQFHCNIVVIQAFAQQSICQQMMIARTISNSWSELLTLCCVPHTSSESMDNRCRGICPQNEHFCTESPESVCHRDLQAKKKREVNYGYCPAPAHCPCSRPVCFHRCFAETDAWNGTTRRRLRVAAGLSVLWAHHAALRNMLPGVWQGI